MYLVQEALGTYELIVIGVARRAIFRTIRRVV